jgi:UDP-2-acetamido-3-amino-2,3-dideoxy-glucuronate N-acetyltransferase
VFRSLTLQSFSDGHTQACLHAEVQRFGTQACVLTNVTNPRSQVNRHSLYEKTILKRGCTIGANATIVCGITIGRYAFIAAGSVVAKDVPDYALIIGVPGKQVGWMSRHGHKLGFDVKGQAICPESKLRYSLTEGVVRCLDVPEDNPLPDNMKKGSRTYDEFKVGLVDS